MPCPAMELGAVEPFVAVFRFERRGKAFCSGAVRRWRVLACWAFGHGMPCPYCGKKAKSKAPAGRRRYEKRRLRCERRLLDYYCGLASGDRCGQAAAAIV